MNGNARDIYRQILLGMAEELQRYGYSVSEIERVLRLFEHGFAPAESGHPSTATTKTLLARSKAGAFGPFQIMPETARRYGFSEVPDPVLNPKEYGRLTALVFLGDVPENVRNQLVKGQTFDPEAVYKAYSIWASGRMYSRDPQVLGGYRRAIESLSGRGLLSSPLPLPSEEARSVPAEGPAQELQPEELFQPVPIEMPGGRRIFRLGEAEEPEEIKVWIRGFLQELSRTPTREGVTGTAEEAKGILDQVLGSVISKRGARKYSITTEGQNVIVNFDEHRFSIPAEKVLSYFHPSLQKAAEQIVTGYFRSLPSLSQLEIRPTEGDKKDIAEFLKEIGNFGNVRVSEEGGRLIAWIGDRRIEIPPYWILQSRFIRASGGMLAPKISGNRFELIYQPTGEPVFQTDVKNLSKLPADWDPSDPKQLEVISDFLLSKEGRHSALISLEFSRGEKKAKITIPVSFRKGQSIQWAQAINPAFFLFIRDELERAKFSEKEIDDILSRDLPQALAQSLSSLRGVSEVGLVDIANPSKWKDLLRFWVDDLSSFATLLAGVFDANVVDRVARTLYEDNRVKVRGVYLGPDDLISQDMLSYMMLAFLNPAGWVAGGIVSRGAKGAASFLRSAAIKLFSGRASADAAVSGIMRTLDRILPQASMSEKAQFLQKLLRADLLPRLVRESKDVWRQMSAKLGRDVVRQAARQAASGILEDIQRAGRTVIGPRAEALVTFPAGEVAARVVPRATPEMARELAEKAMQEIQADLVRVAGFFSKVGAEGVDPREFKDIWQSAERLANRFKNTPLQEVFQRAHRIISEIDRLPLVEGENILSREAIAQAKEWTDIVDGFIQASRKDPSRISNYLKNLGMSDKEASTIIREVTDISDELKRMGQPAAEQLARALEFSFWGLPAFHAIASEIVSAARGDEDPREAAKIVGAILAPMVFPLSSHWIGSNIWRFFAERLSAMGPDQWNQMVAKIITPQVEGILQSQLRKDFIQAFENIANRLDDFRKEAVEIANLSGQLNDISRSAGKLKGLAQAMQKMAPQVFPPGSNVHANIGNVVALLDQFLNNLTPLRIQRQEAARAISELQAFLDDFRTNYLDPKLSQLSRQRRQPKLQQDLQEISALAANVLNEATQGEIITAASSARQLIQKISELKDLPSDLDAKLKKLALSDPSFNLDEHLDDPQFRSQLLRELDAFRDAFQQIDHDALPGPLGKGFKKLKDELVDFSNRVRPLLERRTPSQPPSPPQPPVSPQPRVPSQPPSPPQPPVSPQPPVPSQPPSPPQPPVSPQPRVPAAPSGPFDDLVKKMRSFFGTRAPVSGNISDADAQALIMPFLRTWRSRVRYDGVGQDPLAVLLPLFQEARYDPTQKMIVFTLTDDQGAKWSVELKEDELARLPWDDISEKARAVIQLRSRYGRPEFFQELVNGYRRLSQAAIEFSRSLIGRYHSLNSEFQNLIQKVKEGQSVVPISLRVPMERTYKISSSLISALNENMVADFDDAIASITIGPMGRRDRGDRLRKLPKPPIYHIAKVLFGKLSPQDRVRLIKSLGAAWGSPQPDFSVYELSPIMTFGFRVTPDSPLAGSVSDLARYSLIAVAKFYEDLSKAIGPDHAERLRIIFRMKGESVGKDSDAYDFAFRPIRTIDFTEELEQLNPSQRSEYFRLLGELIDTIRDVVNKVSRGESVPLKVDDVGAGALKRAYAESAGRFLGDFLDEVKERGFLGYLATPLQIAEVEDPEQTFRLNMAEYFWLARLVDSLRKDPHAREAGVDFELVSRLADQLQDEGAKTWLFDRLEAANAVILGDPIFRRSAEIARRYVDVAGGLGISESDVPLLGALDLVGDEQFFSGLVFSNYGWLQPLLPKVAQEMDAYRIAAKIFPGKHDPLQGARVNIGGRVVKWEDAKKMQDGIPKWLGPMVYGVVPPIALGPDGDEEDEWKMHLALVLPALGVLHLWSMKGIPTFLEKLKPHLKGLWEIPPKMGDLLDALAHQPDRALSATRYWTTLLRMIPENEQPASKVVSTNPFNVAAAILRFKFLPEDVSMYRVVGVLEAEPLDLWIIDWLRDALERAWSTGQYDLIPGEDSIPRLANLQGLFPAETKSIIEELTGWEIGERGPTGSVEYVADNLARHFRVPELVGEGIEVLRRMLAELGFSGSEGDRKIAEIFGFGTDEGSLEKLRQLSPDVVNRITKTDPNMVKPRIEWIAQEAVQSVLTDRVEKQLRRRWRRIRKEILDNLPEAVEEVTGKVLEGEVSLEDILNVVRDAEEIRGIINRAALSFLEASGEEVAEYVKVKAYPNHLVRFWQAVIHGEFSPSHRLDWFESAVRNLAADYGIDPSSHSIEDLIVELTRRILADRVKTDLKVDFTKSLRTVDDLLEFLKDPQHPGRIVLDLAKALGIDLRIGNDPDVDPARTFLRNYNLRRGKGFTDKDLENALPKIQLYVQRLGEQTVQEILDYVPELIRERLLGMKDWRSEIVSRLDEPVVKLLAERLGNEEGFKDFLAWGANRTKGMGITAQISVPPGLSGQMLTSGWREFVRKIDEEFHLRRMLEQQPGFQEGLGMATFRPYVPKPGSLIPDLYDLIYEAIEKFDVADPAFIPLPRSDNPLRVALYWAVLSPEVSDILSSFGKILSESLRDVVEGRVAQGQLSHKPHELVDALLGVYRLAGKNVKSREISLNDILRVIFPMERIPEGLQEGLEYLLQGTLISRAIAKQSPHKILERADKVFELSKRMGDVEKRLGISFSPDAELDVDHVRAFLEARNLVFGRANPVGPDEIEETIRRVKGLAQEIFAYPAPSLAADQISQWQSVFGVSGAGRREEFEMKISTFLDLSDHEKRGGLNHLALTRLVRTLMGGTSVPGVVVALRRLLEKEIKVPELLDPSQVVTIRALDLPLWPLAAGLIEPRVLADFLPAFHGDGSLNRADFRQRLLNKLSSVLRKKGLGEEDLGVISRWLESADVGSLVDLAARLPEPFWDTLIDRIVGVVSEIDGGWKNPEFEQPSRFFDPRVVYGLTISGQASHPLVLDAGLASNVVRYIEERLDGLWAEAQNIIDKVRSARAQNVAELVPGGAAGPEGAARPEGVEAVRESEIRDVLVSILGTLDYLKGGGSRVPAALTQAVSPTVLMSTLVMGSSEDEKDWSSEGALALAVALGVPLIARRNLVRVADVVRRWLAQSDYAPQVAAHNLQVSLEEQIDRWLDVALRRMAPQLRRVSDRLEEISRLGWIAEPLPGAPGSVRFVHTMVVTDAAPDAVMRFWREVRPVERAILETLGKGSVVRIPSAARPEHLLGGINRVKSALWAMNLLVRRLDRAISESPAGQAAMHIGGPARSLLALVNELEAIRGETGRAHLRQILLDAQSEEGGVSESSRLFPMLFWTFRQLHGSGFRVPVYKGNVTENSVAAVLGVLELTSDLFREIWRMAENESRLDRNLNPRRYSDEIHGDVMRVERAFRRALVEGARRLLESPVEQPGDLFLYPRDQVLMDRAVVGIDEKGILVPLAWGSDDVRDAYLLEEAARRSKLFALNVPVERMFIVEPGRRGFFLRRRGEDVLFLEGWREKDRFSLAVRNLSGQEIEVSASGSGHFLDLGGKKSVRLGPGEQVVVVGDVDAEARVSIPGLWRIPLRLADMNALSELSSAYARFVDFASSAPYMGLVRPYIGGSQIAVSAVKTFADLFSTIYRDDRVVPPGSRVRQFWDDFVESVESPFAHRDVLGVAGWDPMGKISEAAASVLGAIRGLAIAMYMTTIGSVIANAFQPLHSVGMTTSEMVRLAEEGVIRGGVGDVAVRSSALGALHYLPVAGVVVERVLRRALSDPSVSRSVKASRLLLWGINPATYIESGAVLLSRLGFFGDLKAWMKRSGDEVLVNVGEVEKPRWVKLEEFLDQVVPGWQAEAVGVIRRLPREFWKEVRRAYGGPTASIMRMRQSVDWLTDRVILSGFKLQELLNRSISPTFAYVIGRMMGVSDEQARVLARDVQASTNAHASTITYPKLLTGRMFGSSSPVAHAIATSIWLLSRTPFVIVGNFLRSIWTMARAAAEAQSARDVLGVLAGIGVVGLWGLVFGGLSASMLGIPVEIINQVHQLAAGEGRSGETLSERAAEWLWRRGMLREAVFAKSGLYGLLFAELGESFGVMPDIGSRLGIIDNIIIRLVRESQGGVADVVRGLFPGIAPGMFLVEVGSLLYHAASGDPAARRQALSILSRAFPSNVRRTYIQQALEQIAPEARSEPFGLVKDIGEFLWKLWDTAANSEDPEKRVVATRALVAMFLALGDMSVSQARRTLAEARRARELLERERARREGAIRRILEIGREDDGDEQLGQDMDRIVVGDSSVWESLEDIFAATAPRSPVLLLGNALLQELHRGRPSLRMLIEMLERVQRQAGPRVWKEILGGARDGSEFRELVLRMAQLGERERERMEQEWDRPELWDQTLISLKRAELLLRLFRARGEVVEAINEEVDRQVREFAQRVGMKDAEAALRLSLRVRARAADLALYPFDPKLFPGGEGARGGRFGVTHILRILRQYEVVEDERARPEVGKLGISDWRRVLELLEPMVAAFEVKENQRELAAAAVGATLDGVASSLGAPIEEMVRVEDRAISESWWGRVQEPFTRGYIESHPDDAADLWSLYVLGRQRRRPISLEAIR